MITEDPNLVLLQRMLPQKQRDIRSKLAIAGVLTCRIASG